MFELVKFIILYMMARRRSGMRKAENVVAITGALSFIGSNLVQRLQNTEGYRVVAIDIRKPIFLNENSRFYRVDLTDPSSDLTIYEILENENVNTFIHLAFSRTPGPRVLKSSTMVHELEVVGTWHVLNACGRKKVKHFILGSTTEVYGADPMNPNLLTEEHPIKANPLYSHMKNKVEVEQLVQNFAKRFKEIKVTILRPCTILGPNVQNFMTWYLRGMVIMTVLGYDPMIQFVHEEDVIDGFRLVLEKGASGICNIVGRDALPLSYIIRLAGKVNLPVAYFMMYSTTLAMWLAGISPVPPEHLDFIRYTYVANGQKAQSVLGFYPRYSTKEALEDFTGIQRLKTLKIEPL